jgi:hypothetical protein
MDDEFIELGLTEAEFFALLKIAHERDITFNELCNDILREIIELDKAGKPIFPDRELSGA